MSVFNELMTSFYLYLLLCLTDYHGDTHRDETGLALLILAIFTVMVNLIKVMWIGLRDLRVWCRKKRR